MCSIAGIYRMGGTIGEKERTLLSKMSASMRHRGPDASGTYPENDGEENAQTRCTMAHNRLAVIDLTGGKQPMTVTHGGRHYKVTYNGELYNTEELREELLRMGAHFQTRSDTEVVANAYVFFGEEAPSRMNGIFAFSIYCEEDETLFLARDRFGVKPLFFTEISGTFYFASEVKALFCVRPPRLDRTGLWQLFYLSPVSLPGSGVFKDIYELKGGECAKVTQHGFVCRSYWQLTAEPCTATREEAVEKTRLLLCDAVQRQLVSDVPLACLLSGGLDSSAVTAIAAKAYREKGETLATYSFTYEDKESFHATLFQPNSDDEYAAWLADRLSCDHTVLTAKTEDVVRLLGDAALARDMPGQADIDSSLYFYCAEMKKRHTVILSGECADEIFGGYPWFYRPEMLARDFFPWIHEPRARIGLLRPEIAHEEEGFDFMRSAYLQSLANVPILESDSESMRLFRRATYLSVQYFMTNLLERKDRMSMAHGLEVRVPFADHRLLEWVYNLPPEFKFENGVEKSLLRHAMEGLLPERILWRKKSPYPKTHSPVYERLVRDRLAMRMEDDSSVLPHILNRSALSALCEGGDATWYGQLMSKPQLLAWLLQFDIFCAHYGLEICEE